MYKRYYDIDVDAKAYANNIVKAGGRIPSDINSVSDFIRRLKQNNLFNSVADMWFLREGQNITQGTSRYGLKNMNNICTLINGPTTQASGIRTEAASSQYLKIKTPEIFDDFTLVMFGTNVSTTSTPRLMTFQRENVVSGTDSVVMIMTTQIIIQNSARGGSNTIVLSGYSTSSYSFQGFFISCSPTIFTASRSLISSSSNIPRPLRAQMKNVIYCGGYEISAGVLSNFSNFIYSAVFLFSSNVRDNHTNIYNIYKNTAGKGLGLP